MAGAHLNTSSKSNRPLSPHLQIYRQRINMVMSIVHRLTGVALYGGAIALAWWLFSAAHSAEYFAYVNSWISSWPGRILLVAYTWALMHHMIGGIRHFIWDMGKGFDLKTIDLMSWGTLVLSIITTVLIWLCVHLSGSGAETIASKV